MKSLQVKLISSNIFLRLLSIKSKGINRLRLFNNTNTAFTRMIRFTSWILAQLMKFLYWEIQTNKTFFEGSFWVVSFDVSAHQLHFHYDKKASTNEPFPCRFLFILTLGEISFMDHFYTISLASFSEKLRLH